MQTFVCVVVAASLLFVPALSLVHQRRGAAAALPGCSFTLGDETVDISALHSTTQNWAVTAEDKPSNGTFIFYMNLCGPLVNSTEVAGCLAKDSAFQGCQAHNPPSSKFPFGLGVNGQISKISDSLMDGFVYSFSGGVNTSNTCHNIFARAVKIYFSCGLDLGAPEYVSEDACTYTFLWQSSAACIAGSLPTPVSPPTSCSIVTPNGLTYDLSPLTGIVWNASDSTEQSANDFMISVCGAIPNPPATCKGASVCQLPSTAVAKSLGAPVALTTSGGVLTLNYANAEIDFSCADSSIGLGFPQVRNQNNGKYYFDWATTAACAVQSQQSSGNCQITDDVTGDVYDLSSLNSTTWTVDAFKVSICSAASGCGSSGVCTATTKSSFGVASSQLSKTGSSISLKYSQGTACAANPSITQSTVIVFVCDLNATTPHPPLLLSSNSACSLAFEVRTALVCPHRRTECVVNDLANHNTYDLSALSSTEWTVLGDGYEFLLGVCAPLGSEQPCDTGVAACQTKASDPKFMRSMGVVVGPPELVSPGVLRLTYQNGDFCSGNKFYRSTIITFICDNNAGVGSPTYVAEHQGNCTYEFAWRTALACPATPSQGVECTFQDPLSGALYDLSPLQQKDASVTVDSTTYYAAVCGGLTNPLCLGNAACMVNSKGVKTDLGQESHTITVADRIASITYQSVSTCSSNTHYTSHIMFVCDPNVPPSVPPVLELLPGSDVCTFNFRWHTSLVCGAMQPPVQCSVLHNGLFYDLTSLISPTNNYLAFDNNFMYEFNVCHTLSNSMGPTCGPGSAACQIPTGNSSHTPKSLGLASAPFWDSQYGLSLVYANGTGLCKGNHQRSSVIRFVCPENGIDQQPQYLGESANDCTYTFQWITTAACPVKQIVGHDCQLEDPSSDRIINLAALSALGTQTVTDPNTKDVYRLAVCGKVACAGTADVGACQTTSSNVTYVAGLTNSALMFSDGVATLQYTSGQTCHKTFHRSTTIRFICDLTAGLGQPVFSEELNTCDYVFEWRTSLTCMPTVPCRVSSLNGENVYDLMPLSRSDANWVVSDARQGGKFSYELNVCRALVTHEQWQCDPFAGACQIINSTESDVTLGYIGIPTVETTPSNEPLLVLTYQGGVRGRSTRVEFMCPLDIQGNPIPGIMGEPTFLYETNLTYYFSWRTSVACPLGSFPPAIGTGCTVTSPLLKTSYSLLSLANHTYTLNSGDYSFSMAVCSALTPSANLPSACTGAGSCQTKPTDPSFYRVAGQPNSTLVFQDNVLQLVMTNGQSCKTGYLRTTRITFLCGAGVGTPQFVAETSTCDYSFVWYTKAACGTPSQAQCVVSDLENGVSYDFSPLTRLTSNWVAFYDTDDASFATFEMNVCKALVEPVDPACHGAAACLILSDTVIPIGNVASPRVFDGIPYLEYDGGPCPYGGNYTTYIMFTCSELGYIGRPESMGIEPYSCEFSFMWDTVYACPPTVQTTTKAPAITTTKSPGTGTGTTATPIPTTTTPFIPLSGSQCVASNGHDVVDLSTLSYNGVIAVCSADSDDPTSCQQYTYYIHVCGYSTENCGPGPVSACQIPKASGAIKSMGYYTQPPAFVGDQLMLEYENGDTCHQTYQRRTRILFQCDMNAGTGAPVFSTETADCVYVFIWATAVACVKTQLPRLNCLVHGADNSVYDLHALGRRPGLPDYTVQNTPAGTNLTLNMCRMLNQWPGTECEGAAACLSTTTFDGTPVQLNLGYALSEPVVRSDGSITIVYSLPNSYNSQRCTTQSLRTTVVTLTCLEGHIGTPILQDTLSDCVFYVSWATYAACSLNQTTTAPDAQTNCSLIDSVTGNVYDMSPLSVATASVSVGQYTYDLSVCDIAPSCTDGAAACQHDGTSSKTYSMGKPSTHLRLTDDDELVLTYVGGQACHNNTKDSSTRSTVITFTCDPSIAVGKPQFIAETADCTYFFSWATKAACPLTRNLPCQYVDPSSGKQYDLSPLKLTRGNWPIETNSKANSQYLFELNVCHSLNPVKSDSPFVGCDLGSGVCQVEISNHNITYNLGLPSVPTMVNGNLTIVYSNGDTCHNHGPRNTTVTFVCPKTPIDSAFPLGRPQFSAETTTCNYNIVWETNAACPLTAPQTTTSCTVPVVNSITGEIYDIEAMNRMYSTTNTATGHVYQINPCGSLGNNCTADPQAHACQHTSDGDFSLGSNATWTFGEHGISLKVTSGTPCHNTAYFRSAVILFSCNTEADLGPLFVQETAECIYEFNWPSPMACPYTPTLDCGTHLPSGRFADLSSLSVLNGALSIPSNLGTFYMNVCHRAIHPGCLASAGVCLVPSDGASPLSLGKFNGLAPTLSHDESAVVLQYQNGSPCKSNPSVQIQSIITFTCGNFEAPRLQHYLESPTECQYQFTWETCSVCPSASTCSLPTTPNPHSTPHTPSPPSSSTHGGSSGGSHAVGIAMGILIPTLLIGGICFLFYRRPDLWTKVKDSASNLYTRSRGGAPGFRYHKVGVEGGASSPESSSSSIFGTGDDDDADDDELMPM